MKKILNQALDVCLFGGMFWSLIMTAAFAVYGNGSMAVISAIIGAICVIGGRR